jgi:hypothetical protein
VPTFHRTDQFKRDFQALSVADRRRAQQVIIEHFVADLTAIEEGRQADFRRSLKVVPMRARPGVMEMRWEPSDGRATFSYGEPQVVNKRHVVWRRIGTHAIYGDP